MFIYEVEGLMGLVSYEVGISVEDVMRKVESWNSMKDRTYSVRQVGECIVPLRVCQ